MIQDTLTGTFKILGDFRSFNLKEMIEQGKGFLKQYLQKYIVESYNEDYYKIYNGSILHLLIDFLNFRKVKYIIMDGFAHD